MNTATRFLKKPEGVKDLLPEKAALKRHCEEILSKQFSAWGYKEVVPPTVEFSDIFTAGMKSNFEEELHCFPDGRGRTLVLRPDLTLPLARIVATHMQQEPLPLRLFYLGNVFRYISSKTGRQREFFQAGTELLGEAAPGADTEIIALAIYSLEVLGIKEVKICLGNLEFLNTYLSQLDIGSKEQENIKKIFNQKDFVALEKYVDEISLSREVKQEILAIPTLKGGKEVLEEARQFFSKDFPCLQKMTEILYLLECLGVDDRVMVDLGLVRGLDYYTGVIFEGYTSNLGSAVCGGGRYDRLLDFFGCSLPAVGFALNIDNILFLLSRTKRESIVPKTLVAFATEALNQAHHLAISLRKNGSIIEMAFKSMSLEEARNYARVHQAEKLVYVEENRQVTEII